MAELNKKKIEEMREKDRKLRDLEKKTYRDEYERKETDRQLLQSYSPVKSPNAVKV